MVSGIRLINMEILTSFVVKIMDGLGMITGGRRIIIVSSAPEFIIKVK